MTDLRFESQGIVLELDNSIPAIFETGNGAFLQISGHFIDPGFTIHAIQLQLHPPVHDTLGYVLASGQKKGRVAGDDHSSSSRFFFAIPFRHDNPPVEITLEITRNDTSALCFPLGTVTPALRSDELLCSVSHRRISSYLKENSSHPHFQPVVIGLATYNPDIELFTRQIQSIREQDYPNWFCLVNDDCSDLHSFQKIREVIGDDDRFLILRNEQNLGFYKNFERILQFIPADTPFIALCDQDDRWYPDKLRRLVSAFDGKTLLTFSDMRIVDRNGETLFPSFWMNRTVHYQELDLQILDNTITGAACMFRGSLLHDILPFPPDAGTVFHNRKVAFHDHWIGCVALAKGEVRYIPEPLHDYYQQGQNCAGFYYHTHENGVKKSGTVLRKIRTDTPGKIVERAFVWFLTYGIQKILFAKILEMRIIPDGGEKQEDVALFSSFQGLGVRMMSLLWRLKSRRGVSCDAEKIFFLGYITWRIFRRFLSRFSWSGR
jgi:glycosyltransferase involved in cell wall biosynthesis